MPIDHGDDLPPIVKLKTEKTIAVRRKTKLEAAKEEALAFKLWKLGVDHGSLQRLKEEAASSGRSLQVHVRESLGIVVPGAPVVQVPIVSPSRFLLDDEVTGETASTLQCSAASVRYLDYFIRIKDCETFRDLEFEINAQNEACEREHSGGVALVHFRRVPGSRFQLMFRISPQFQSLWRYVVRVFRVRRLDHIPLAMTLFNCEIHPSAELVSYAYLTRFGGFRLVAVFRRPISMDSLR